MEKIKNLIVGCGLSGVVLAERIASEMGEKVLIIDRRHHIAGNIYDYKDKGITVHKYGPHIFHTNIKRVWDYLNQFTKFHVFWLKPLAVVEGQPVNIPFNLNTLQKVFPKSMAEKLEQKLLDKYGYGKKVPILDLKNTEDTDLQFLAQYVYDHIFEKYTIKQWGLKPEEIDPTVMARVPVYISRDDRYFQDPYQGIPEKGYTKMVEKILDNPLIEIRLDTDFKDIKDSIEYNRLIYTGAIDEYFEYELGELPYRALRFDICEEPVEYFQGSPQVNYPNNYDFTRICESKHFLNEKTSTTILSYEYPEAFEKGKNERAYPIENPKNRALYDQYQEKAKVLRNVYFVGRLGDYKYYNMDLTVDRALKLFDKIKENEQ